MRIVVSIASLGGFALGIAHVEWQWALEHAQVIAGVVSYQPDSPMGQQQAAAWSLVNQLGALGLLAGLSEAALSWWISGLLGAASCAGLALIIHAISRRPWASLLALPIVIGSRAVDWGVAYPIALYGTGHTYGAAGLATAALAFGLLGAGAPRAGAFVMAASPAIHPVLGGTTWLVVLAAWVWWRVTDQATAREWARRARGPIMAGAALTAVSFAAHVSLQPDVVTDVPEEAWPLVYAFVRYWDGHRQPIGWDTGAVRLVTGLGIVAVVVVIRRLWTAFGGSASMFRLAGSAAAVGIAAVALTHIPPESQASWLIAAMPGRLLNLPLLLAIPVLVGLALTLRGRSGAATQCLFAVSLLVSRRSFLWPLVFGFREGGATPPGLDQLTVVGLFAVVIVSLLIRQAASPPDAADVRDVSPVMRSFTAVALVASVLASGLVALDARREWRRRGTLLSGSVNESVLREVFAADRILTGGDLMLVQLRTRRPVVLNSGALDVVTYAPASAPAIERMLNELYGLSLLAPPPAMKPEGRVPADVSREVWRNRSREEWQRLATAYGFTHVVTYPDWGLALESLSTGGGIQAFRVPARRP